MIDRYLCFGYFFGRDMGWTWFKGWELDLRMVFVRVTISAVSCNASLLKSKRIVYVKDHISSRALDGLKPQCQLLCQTIGVS